MAIESIFVVKTVGLIRLYTNFLMSPSSILLKLIKKELYSAGLVSDVSLISLHLHVR